jgi:hypothetical protein
MNQRALHIGVLACALVLCMGMSASAGSLIWGVNPSDVDLKALYNIDPWTGVVSVKYSTPLNAAGHTEIGLAGWASALYYTDANAANDTVYVIDPATGLTTSTFTVSGGWEIDGLGYYSDATGSYLYTSGCSVNDVHRYDATNGASPQFYWSDVTNPTSIAGDNGGRIFAYGIGATGGWGIWEMDPLVDSSATFFANSPSTSVVGMAFDGTYLYLADKDQKLFTMNMAGQVVNTLQLNYTLYALGSTQGTGTVPEPASLLLLGTGLAAVGARLRRRH